MAKVNFGNDVPANLLTSIVLLDTARAGRSVAETERSNGVFALERRRRPGRPDGPTEVIRIHISGAPGPWRDGEVTYTYSTTLSQPIEHATLTASWAKTARTRC